MVFEFVKKPYIETKPLTKSNREKLRSLTINGGPFPLSDFLEGTTLDLNPKSVLDSVGTSASEIHRDTVKTKRDENT